MSEHGQIIDVSFCNSKCEQTENCPIKIIQTRKARGNSAIEEALALQNRRKVSMHDQFHGQKPPSGHSQISVICTKNHRFRSRGGMTITADFYSR